MLRREILTWEEFYNLCVVKKNLVVQYEEDAQGYDIYAVDGGIVWRLRLAHGTQECTVFESTQKAKCNYACGVSHLPFPVDNYECAYDGIGVTEITEEEHKLYFRIPEEGLFLPGGECIGENIGLGDWFEMYIVDHDNLLGYGVDFVLKHWMRKRHLGNYGCKCTTPYVGQPPYGFYIMIVYHRVGSLGLPAPKICINFDFHKKVL